MGAFISKLFAKLLGPKDVKLLLLGLAAAGKTTILYKMKFGEVVSSVPTIGFNVETVDYKNLKFTMWDVGGQDSIRKLWHHYYSNTDGLIFVVDSSDKENIDLAREELTKMLAEEDLRDSALLVFANKIDLRVMTVPEVAEKLGLPSMKGREWFIQGTCALTGDGLYEGFEWMAKALKTRK